MDGYPHQTRNYPVRSSFFADPFYFVTFPLVQSRTTAWKKALLEMEWFMSGKLQCPAALLNWWDGQLNPENRYYGGYGQQLRRHGVHQFDQIGALLDGLKKHPDSRRLILTTWDPWTMSRIGELNHNPKTPTCCHGTITQFAVISGRVHATTYQRSADVLLGLPHNFVQYWGLLLYCAHYSGLAVGSLRYILGDAHLYDEPSHLECAKALVTVSEDEARSLPFIDLRYEPKDIRSYSYDSIPPFLANDFYLSGHPQLPVTEIRPKLL